MTKKKDEPRDAPGGVAQFESALSELEKIVGALERGDLKLEESLKLFERGMALTRQCRQSLDSAELKIKQLLDTKPEDLLP
jgi:exodeoxyribonuclease VII small subunit